MLRVDAVDHDDLADAAADVFVEEPRIWRRPLSLTYAMSGEEGAFPVQPDDDATKRNPLAQSMLDQIAETEKEYAANMGPGHGPDEYILPPREPV